MESQAEIINITLMSALLPLLSAILSTIVPSRYSWTLALLAPLLLCAAAILSLIALVKHEDTSRVLSTIEWFRLGEYTVNASIFINHTTITMVMVVSVVSFLVHLFSVGYMAGEAGIKRYFAMLGFFTFAMQGIVLSDNLLLLFVFWELVGFSSYFLIGHWNEKKESGYAAQKAFVMNRIGDAGFLAGLMIIYATEGTFDISALPTVPMSTIAGLCILCGVIAKSAQFPLFTWLPDAMAGPTPVSALIHAATMVAAGVFLILRIHPVFDSVSLAVMTYVGMATGVAAGIAALFQFDIKRVLAYSTVSQLGLMIMVLGVGDPQAVFLHLFAHAFFKAGLFLGVGAVIHSVSHAASQHRIPLNAQDTRQLGGLRKQLPITFYCFIVCAAALAGIPMFSGFLSKEAMLTSMAGSPSLHILPATIGLLIISFITILYTFRLVNGIFFGEQRSALSNIHEVPGLMRLPLVLLALCSLWFVISFSPVNPSGWLYWERQGSIDKLIVSFVIVAVALYVGYRQTRSGKWRTSHVFLNGFYVDHFYQVSVVPLMHRAALATSFLDSRVIDRALHAIAYIHVTGAHIVGWIDKYVVDGIVHFAAALVRFTGSVAKSFQSGKIQLYIFWSVLAMIIFIIWSLKK
jgi:NADH-quinone oxidoreductase subunit L